jgi:hypothetical protein
MSALTRKKKEEKSRNMEVERVRCTLQERPKNKNPDACRAAANRE